ncbi:MAG TPA: aminotransferase class IV [Solirubrobacteraceae bacterium]|nr:aminotransferase class IV [Solirubrobacteraceae bacterium]
MSGPGPSSLASVDGAIMPVAEATLPITDPGLVRGDGAFEVMRVYDGVPFAVEEHLARLQRSGANLRLPIDVEAVRAETFRLLAQAGDGPDHQLVRVMVTRGGRRLIMTEQLPDRPEFLRCKTVTYAPTRILDGIKSLSYAANMQAGRLAAEAGYDEAILVTPHGRVLEAPTSSLFWVEGETLLTPPLDDHILASITRAIILQVTGAREEVCPLERLLGADEIFIASTTREAQGVIAVDETEIAAPGPVTKRTEAAVVAHIRSKLTG